MKYVLTDYELIDTNSNHEIVVVCFTNINTIVISGQHLGRGTPPPGPHHALVLATAERQVSGCSPLLPPSLLVTLAVVA